VSVNLTDHLAPEVLAFGIGSVTLVVFLLSAILVLLIPRVKS
jgi:hypothetical protein